MKTPMKHIANQLYSNPARTPRVAGTVCFPFDGGYFPRIDHAAYRELPPAERFGKSPHTHLVYHIVLCTGGEGTFVHAGSETSAQKGLLLCVSPGEPHSFNNGPGETKEYCVITFEWLNAKQNALTLPFAVMLSRWSGRACVVPSTALLPHDTAAMFLMETESLVRLGLGGAEGAEEATLHSLWRILCALSHHFSREEPSPDAEHRLLRIKRYLDTHYAEPLALPALAASAGLTPNHLSHAFRKQFGMSPVQYLRRLRIQIASSLLINTEYPLKTVAARTGFSDIYYFSRVFTAIAGMPPATYRNRHRGPGSSDH